MSPFLFGIALGVYFFIVFFRPKIGGLIILALLPSYLWRISLWGIPTTFLEMSIYVWFVVTFVTMARERAVVSSVRLVGKSMRPFLLPIALFVAAATISVFVSGDVRLSAGAWKAWVVDPLIFLVLFTHYYQWRDDGKWVMYGISGTVWLVSVWGLIEWGVGFGMQIPGFANAMFQSANMVALLLVPLWLILCAHTFELFSTVVSDNRERAYWLATLFVGALTIYMTRSYGGLLTLLAGVVALILILPRSLSTLKKYLIASLVVVAVIVIFGIFQQGKIQRFFDSSQRNSLQTRQQIWQVSAGLVGQHPLWGVGFGNFEKPYRTLAFSLYQPPLEWEVPSAHNLFLNLWLETGLLGLIAFVWLVAVFFKRAASLLRASLARERAKINSAGTIVARGVMVAMLSIVMYGLVDTPYFKNDLSIQFWFIVGMWVVLEGHLLLKEWGGK